MVALASLACSFLQPVTLRAAAATAMVKISFDISFSPCWDRLQTNVDEGRSGAYGSSGQLNSCYIARKSTGAHMVRATGALILLVLVSTAAAADTDFGVRELGKPARHSEPPPAGEWASYSGRSVDMSEASRIGSRWGQVTSTFRTAAHTRDVGGVAN